MNQTKQFIVIFSFFFINIHNLFKNYIESLFDDNAFTNIHIKAYGKTTKYQLSIQISTENSKITFFQTYIEEISMNHLLFKKNFFITECPTKSAISIEDNMI